MYACHWLVLGWAGMKRHSIQLSFWVGLQVAPKISFFLDSLFHCHSCVIQLKTNSDSPSRTVIDCAMSLLDAPLDAAAADAAVATMDANIVHLFEQKQIPHDIIAKIADAGYTDVEVFAEFADKVENVRATIKTDLGLDPEKGAKHRAMTGRLITAWKTAVARGAAKDKEEAEQRVGDLPRTLPKSQHQELLRSHAKAYYEELPDGDTHAPS